MLKLSVMNCPSHHDLQVAILSGIACSAILLSACDSEETTADTTPSIVQANDQINISADEYCGDPDQTPVRLSREARSPSGEYLVRIVELVEPVPSNRIFPLRIEVQGPYGIEANQISVRADASMPHHGHGMTVRPVAQPVVAKPGAFEISGMMFHMPGEWELYIDITDGPYTERVIFHALAK